MTKQLSIAILFLCAFAFSQDAYMNLAHSPGITPSSTITVIPEQVITFEYGGGGAHPMTSDNNSPMYFPTVTVTSSNPIATFSLTDVGTYTFHCGTNPGNSNLWGTIIVEEAEVQILYGDVNLDEVINVLDIISVVNHILGMNALGGENFVPADMNTDELINVLDILQIVNIILNTRNEDGIASAKLQQNELSVSGSVGGIQFNGELLSSINGNDIVQSANGITLIYNMTGKLETESFELSENSSDLVVSSSMGKEVELQTVSQFAILDNYPNPFNPSTTISYQLNQNGQININIFDLNGKLIDELVNDYKEMGNYSINWNASNLANGVYIVKLQSNKFTEMRKITLLK